VFFGGPRLSFWWGWPLAFGPWYWWGYPYDYYYGTAYYPAYPAGERQRKVGHVVVGIATGSFVSDGRG